MGGHRAAVGRTKGIYLYSISPFFQRPFRGFRSELLHSFQAHYKWGIYFTTIALGGYGIVRWANADYHHRSLKNPADYENEVIE